MRLWFSGPRLFNGLVRPGISLGREDLLAWRWPPQAKEMPLGDAEFKEIVAERALTVLRRLAKRGMVAKSGASRNAK
ncbi:MAG: hypothetical protein M3178_14215 [Pseudomonadota bacterium]|nr:hypothetical protein [Pseudomonadota bacterium]